MKLRNRIFMAAGSIILITIIWLGYIQLLETHGVLKALLALLGITGLIAVTILFIVLIAMTALLVIANLIGT